jgi:Fe-S cluster assembly protein SufD
MGVVDLFRSEFESVNGSAPDWIKPLRVNGMDRFAALGLPTTRLEEWKYTDVSALARMPFRNAVAEPPAAAAERIARPRLGSGPRLVFINGHYSERLSSTTDTTTGLYVGSLAQAFEERADIVKPHLARLADLESQSFTALNTAFLHDGAFVHLGRRVCAMAPVHLLFVSLPPAAQPNASHPRVLIVAEEGSEASIVEDYVGDGVYFSNGVTEVVIGEDAKIDHYRLQREASDAFHVATVEARQARNSRFRSYAVSFGASLARVSIRTVMEAEGCECVFDGLYMARDRQHVDHHTCIDHRRPRCSSRELYKGVLDGKATGVFNGKVYVRPDAQKSDAQQMNMNLLLSDEATVDTKPQLEIFADDVKCSHGAAIGRLDDDALFYFRSRGIDACMARELLIRGFANQLVARMPLEPVRSQLHKSLAARWDWTDDLEASA